jgi:nuclease-like protein
VARVLRTGGEYLRSRTNWWRRLFVPRTWRYAAGMRGEALVAAELDRLSRRHWVLHDVKVPGWKSNVDHVVVGPRGIFAIETKYYAAEVEGVEGGTWKRRAPGAGWLRWGGWTRIDDPTLQAWNNARRLEARLEKRFDLSDVAGPDGRLVHPIVVFAHPRSRVRARGAEVTVVPLGRLRWALRHRGRRGLLDAAARRDLASELAA